MWLLGTPLKLASRKLSIRCPCADSSTVIHVTSGMRSLRDSVIYPILENVDLNVADGSLPGTLNFAGRCARNRSTKPIAHTPVRHCEIAARRGVVKSPKCEHLRSACARDVSRKMRGQITRPE